MTIPKTKLKIMLASTATKKKSATPTFVLEAGGGESGTMPKIFAILTINSSNMINVIGHSTIKLQPMIVKSRLVLVGIVISKIVGEHTAISKQWPVARCRRS